MTIPPPLRALAALGSAAALVVLLTVPPCAPSVCTMDEAGMAACDPLAADCCQTQGEQTAAAGLHLLQGALAPASPPPGAAAEEAPVRPVPPARSGEVVPPPILQGVGLHTFHSVFLI